jgi:cytochrome P450
VGCSRELACGHCCVDDPVDVHNIEPLINGRESAFACFPRPRDVTGEGARDELDQYMDVMIADRCRRSTDDLLAKLIELEVDGEELTVDDIRRFVADLVAGAS